MYLPDYERLRVRCRKDKLLKRYLDFKSGHLALERWKRRKPKPVFYFQPKKAVVIPPENIAAIALLKAWRNEDAEEQRETWEYLRGVLDEDRLSDRKFFS